MGPHERETVVVTNPPGVVGPATTGHIRVAGRCLVATLLVVLGACGGNPEGGAPEASTGAPAGGRLVVYTVNYPLTFFAERIGGEHVEVRFPAPADVDPAFWQPDVDTIAAYQQGDLIVRNGAGYAKWMELVSLPDSKVVYTSAAFFADVIVEEGTVTHTHGPEGEHSHGETAFTTWLDPRQAIQQAEAIAQALARARPDAAAEFEANMASLRADLESLDARLEELLTPLAGTPLLASHPVYQYLARRYGLDLAAVLFEPDQVPGAESWSALESLRATHPAATMIWQAEPMTETAATLRGMGVESVVFQIAANRPARGDYLDVMRANLDNLAARFAEGR